MKIPKQDKANKYDKDEKFSKNTIINIKRFLKERAQTQDLPVKLN